MEKINAKKVCNAILEAQGNLTEAARALGVSRPVVAHWAETEEACKAAVAEANETLVDMAEGMLIRMALEGEGGPDVRLLQYYLNAKGTARGYGKSVENQDEGALYTAMAAIRKHYEAQEAAEKGLGSD